MSGAVPVAAITVISVPVALPPESALAAAGAAAAAGAIRVPPVAVAGSVTGRQATFTATVHPAFAVAVNRAGLATTAPNAGELAAWTGSSRAIRQIAEIAATGPDGTGMATVGPRSRRLALTVESRPRRKWDPRGLAGGVTVHVAERSNVIRALRALGWVIFEAGRSGAGLEAELATADTIHITSAAGAPGLVDVTGRSLPDVIPARFPASELFDRLDPVVADDPDLDLDVNDRCLDAVLIAGAVPRNIAALQPWQDQFVARYLRSRNGLACTAPPGSGKTVAALAALASDYHAHPTLQATIVVPDALVTQWADEAVHWFEQFSVPLTVSAGTDASGSVHIAGYRHLHALTGRACDHLVVDEAAVLRTRTPRSRLLWDLRARAGRALPLTGTPVEATADDPGTLLAFVLGDRNLFRNRPLRSRWAGDGTAIAGRDGSTVPWTFADELGPWLVSAPRPGELPAVTYATAATGGADLDASTLRAAYLSWVDAADHPAIGRTTGAGIAARRHLRNSRLALINAWEALRTTLTEERLRWAVTCTISEPAVVFTDRETTVQLLLDAYTRNGRLAGPAGPGDHAILEQGGVIVCTRAHARGRNLQAASAVVHVDTAATPSQFEQRNARVARYGTAERVVTVHVAVDGPVTAAMFETISGRRATGDSGVIATAHAVAVAADQH